MILNMEPDQQDSFLEDVSDFVDSKTASAFVFSSTENGFILDGYSQSFTCLVCGVEVSGDASPCDCGTVWNVYPIYEGDSVRTVARKVETDMVPMKVASVKQDAITLL